MCMCMRLCVYAHVYLRVSAYNRQRGDDLIFEVLFSPTQTKVMTTSDSLFVSRTVCGLFVLYKIYVKFSFKRVMCEWC